MASEPVLGACCFNKPIKSQCANNRIRTIYATIVKRLVNIHGISVLDGIQMSIREQPFSFINGLVYNQLPTHSLASCQCNGTIASETSN